ncbi:hypothetical protein QBL02_02855 [Leucobacter sp. UT-8R-CII-1-4]|uniref:hypothetical protein n=1 Tax=Leucobacter sp. UT-8R-CII-1-4 TaxID=3040075 RepID=UPI0024A99370|nr:hypothetical protein [Leucobacter sp. UT-8R-CII-1-4]MDI6022478.1 hypothetical protein [Leucobacter sp. UT-8R-CII-1-4]
MSHASTETIAPRKRRSRWIAALVALCLTAAGVVVYTAAANAATELTTFVSSQDGETDQVDATVLTSSTLTLTDDWYVCDSTTAINAPVSVANGASVGIILGDSCSLSLNSSSIGIKVPVNSSLDVYSQVKNTGRAVIIAQEGPGIGTINEDHGLIRIYGGHIATQGMSAVGHAYPGIGVSGGSGLLSPYAISVRWNASVYAIGSSGTSSTPSGPGLGSAAYTPTISSPNPGIVAISTSGVVQAFSGTAGNFSASPNIGRGTWASGSYSPLIDTYSVARDLSGPGTMQIRDWAGVITNLADLSSVAFGSSVTFVATPNSGAKIRTVDSGLNFVSTDGVSSTYRLPVTGSVSKAAHFWHPTTPTVTTTPAGSQTFPGNVTINGTVTQDSTSARIGTFGQAQLWINGVLAQTQNVIAGRVAFTHTAPPIGTYSYQIKYLGVTDSPFLATSESAPLTGFEVLSTDQNPLAINGISPSGYTYGDAPAPITVTGGSGTGAFDLTSSNPAVASFGTITAGTSPLTINQAGTFTVTGTRAGDTNYAEATLTSPPITVTAATPVATLTRTGGDTQTTPVDVTMTVNARGTGTTPQGYVQFSLNNQALGAPLPLVDNGDGTASVSLTGIPLTKNQSQSIQANYLGQTGKYATVTKTSTWYLGADGFCLAETLPTP